MGKLVMELKRGEVMSGQREWLWRERGWELRLRGLTTQ